MKGTKSLSLIISFTAIIVGSDFALAGALDVKLMDSMVFLAAFLFGFRAGAAIGILSEAIWSFVSPWGVAGAIAPFLIAGELLFAAAGWAASRVWGTEVRQGSVKALFIGATMCICAFFWDFETNAATALLGYWPHLTVSELVLTEVAGAMFFLSHDVSDFLLGLFFIPAAIPLVIKAYRWRA
ncbi:MAG TPA: hypothetical protein VEJ36_00985 [Nitrososphaerales archaeon]|nr:hypothetical protein [Nitrososphaerales archaeon]